MMETNIEKILEAYNLSKTYGFLRAVDGVSFSIQKGEILGLLGPNGAGKTTIINIIAGLLEKDGGNISIFGKDFSQNRSEILSRMNFAATYAQLPGNLKVRENLLIYALLYNSPNPKVIVENSIADFSLIEFANKKTGLLSSGEQSRLALAKALINKPKLLLLDEPTASIDPSASEQIRSRIKKYVKESGASVLWTSHDMYEIEAVCDRVLFLSRGKILLEGNPKELPKKFDKKNLEELFIMVTREPLSVNNQ